MRSPKKEEADPYRGTRPQEVPVSDVVKLTFSVLIPNDYLHFENSNKLGKSRYKHDFQYYSRIG